MKPGTAVAIVGGLAAVAAAGVGAWWWMHRRPLDYDSANAAPTRTGTPDGRLDLLPRSMVTGAAPAQSGPNLQQLLATGQQVVNAFTDGTVFDIVNDITGGWWGSLQGL